MRACGAHAVCSCGRQVPVQGQEGGAPQPPPGGAHHAPPDGGRGAGRPGRRGHHPQHHHGTSAFCPIHVTLFMHSTWIWAQHLEKCKKNVELR